MADVKLDWFSIYLDSGDTWQTKIVPKLEATGINLKDLSRAVYVIALAGSFCINYPRGKSPCVYVGEGNLQERISSHMKKWLIELDALSDLIFMVHIAVPRVKNASHTYRDCEAAIIERFVEKFGCAPLWNKQKEKRICSHTYPTKEIDKAISIGQGRRFLWSVEPMPASKFYEPYYKTSES